MASFAAVLVVSSFAVGSVHSEKVMRRHGGLVQTELDAGGKLSVFKDEPKEAMDIDAQLERVNSANKARSSLKVTATCDWNYTKGTAKTNNCAAMSAYIEEDLECKNQAMLACPDPPHACIGETFVLEGEEAEDKAPKRCYVSDETPPKWYFNNAGGAPANIIGGTPVCKQVEYINGTQDTNSCGSDHYENIMDEEVCRKAANCINDCAYEEFRVLTADDQNAAPKGCHKTAATSVSKGCVRFNNMSAIVGHADPTGPKGQALCKKK